MNFKRLAVVIFCALAYVQGCTCGERENKEASEILHRLQVGLSVPMKNVKQVKKDSYWANLGNGITISAVLLDNGDIYASFINLMKREGHTISPKYFRYMQQQYEKELKEKEAEGKAK